MTFPRSQSWMETLLGPRDQLSDELFLLCSLVSNECGLTQDFSSSSSPGPSLYLVIYHGKERRKRTGSLDIMETFRLGPLFLASEASDLLCLLDPTVGLWASTRQVSSECGSGPPASTSGGARKTCSSQPLPQTCWGLRNLHLNPIPQVSLMFTSV